MHVLIPQNPFSWDVFSLLALKSTAWATTSIILLELVRFLYHVAHHESEFLYEQLHKWHHRTYKYSFQSKDSLATCKSFWYYDLPEAFSMVIVEGTLLGLFYFAASPSLDVIVGILLGCCYALKEVALVILKFCGVQWAIDTDVNHRTDDSLVARPGRWKVNLSYHWRHHFQDERAYLSGIYSLADQLLGTSLSLRSRCVYIVGELGLLHQPLQEQLVRAGSDLFPDPKSYLFSHFNDIDVLILSAMSSDKSVEELFEYINHFLKTFKSIRDVAIREIWIFFPETELSLGAESAGEVSQKVFSNLVSFIRLTSPCVIRKIVVKQLNRVSEAQEIAQEIINAVQKDSHNIVPGQPSLNLWYKFKETLGLVYGASISRTVFRRRYSKSTYYSGSN